MKLDASLLTSFDDDQPIPQDLQSFLTTRGSYSTVQFVLRLSPKVHRIISTTQSGIQSAATLTFEQVEAFSTLLHETIHWWQHIGSTAGMILSLSHPAQSHANYTHLKKFLEEIGPKKSILKYSESLGPPGTRKSKDIREINIIINNFMDIEFFKVISTRPDLIRDVTTSPYFECIGLSYEVTYGQTIALISSIFDREMKFLPDPRKWEPEFDKLRTAKEEGFYYGSRIGVPPVGLRELFEGQARFIQLQYLHFGSGAKLSWNDARDLGQLSKMYVSAFEYFLQLTESRWPENIGDPLVGLFLVVCDIVINPGEGFPCPILHAASFIFDNDPGTRFVAICKMIALKKPELKTAITAYTKDEYIHVTSEICKLLLTPSPLDIAATIVGWSTTQQTLVQLMEEDRRFEFSPENLPARLLFARYVNFCADKLQRPEVFCWPGAWFAGERVSAKEQNLFLGHQALFVNKADRGGIFPTELPGRDPDVVHETFNRFYAWSVIYDLARQWMVREGPFEYGYEWLSEEHPPDQMKFWANRHFEQAWGINPDAFEIL